MTTSGLYVYQYGEVILLLLFPAHYRVLSVELYSVRKVILNTNVVIYTAEKTHPPNEREGIRTVDRATRGIHIHHGNSTYPYMFLRSVLSVHPCLILLASVRCRTITSHRLGPPVEISWFVRLRCTCMYDCRNLQEYSVCTLGCFQQILNLQLSLIFSSI